ncbi:MAG: DUF2461 domain-containing protein [Burkholderiaceae bacterium]
MHVRDLVRFLAELADNNNRAWFVMNQPRYDILRAEFLQLTTRLIAGIVRFDPAVAGCDPKKALFRINRDLRFARDKRPYKTTFSAAITASGLKKPSQGGGPMYYFQFSHEGVLTVAAGEYRPPPERLRAIRRHLVEDAAGFDQVLKNRKLRAGFGDLRRQEQLARPPKGFAADDPHADYIRLKGFVVGREIALEGMAPDAVEAAILAGFRDAWPLVEWLRAA